jgi:hypothetical protein
MSPRTRWKVVGTKLEITSEPLVAPIGGVGFAVIHPGAAADEIGRVEDNHAFGAQARLGDVQIARVNLDARGFIGRIRQVDLEKVQEFKSCVPVSAGN